MDQYFKFQTEISQLISSTASEYSVAIAVSGGSDSLALCFLMNQWLKEKKAKLIAITIDHQLRPESSDEARQVHEWLSAYNIAHVIIPWIGAKASSNLQETARLARYKLLTDYCNHHNIEYLVTGHQQNDQAENFIIRADHGAGVYGLAGIPAVTTYNNIKVIRPLLNFTKKELQAYLIERNLHWIEDPSNQNERFVRVKARNFLQKYPQWVKKLANISINLTRAKEAIDYLLQRSIKEMVTFSSPNHVTIELEAFNQLPQEIRFRMIERLLQKVSKQPKPARAERIEKLLTKIATGMEFKASTLSNCIIKRKKHQIIIIAEEC